MTMKKFNFLLPLLFTFLLVTCGNNEAEDTADTVKLAANPSELVFDYQGGTLEMVLTSGTRPAVSCSDSWVSLSPGTYSSNLMRVSVSATENTGVTERSTSIRVIGNKQSLMIPVSQGVAPMDMSVDKSSVTIDRFGGEVTVTVTSATQPTVSTATSWCMAQAGTIGSSKETEITICAAPNRDAEQKEGTVTVNCGSQSISVSVLQEAYVAPSTASASALTADQVFGAMAPGWNMGNHMDAISNGVASETVWGNPKCTQATMDGVKAAGLKAVRICTTWEGHIGDAPAYRLEEKWLSRVEEIVGYAEKAGLVAIVNTHHDESYWQDISKAYNNSAQNQKVMDEIYAVWTQIALRFKDKGEWLVMESFNEIQDGGWGWSTAFRNDPDAQYSVLNQWNQTFVDAVRSTGGNNATRWLGIPGYAANPGFTIAGLKLPTDYTSANRLMVAVHDYDPYNYTLNNPLVRQWGHTADASLRVSSNDEAAVVAVFDNLKEAYLDKDIPVYLGEMGCSRHTAQDIPYQKYYMEYFCKSAADHKLPMFIWDNGVKGTGSETHAYIDHGTGAFADDTAKELIGIMVKAVTTTDPSYTLESVYNSAP